MQLCAKGIDIVRISKLLAKYNVNASVSKEGINLSGEISEELIKILCSELEVLSVENNGTEVADCSYEILYRGDYRIMDKTQDYDLRYPVVKRGEIYLCDCGSAYGSEMMGVRFVLVIQNDIANTHSPLTIVVPITSKISHYNSDYTLNFSEKTLIDFDPKRTRNKKASFICSQIKTVDKKRLRQYIGTLRKEVLEKIVQKVKISLQLTGEE